VFKTAGHAILRSQGDAQLAAAITFGPYGGFHGHYDKLSFVFFGRGRELGVDPGRARSQAYRLPIHRNWYKASVGHNVVLVDRASQKPAEGRLESFAANGQYAAVATRCNAAYPGVAHRRVLCLTPAYLLVFDQLTADREHRFDWVYHNRGEGIRCETASSDVDVKGTFAGSEYIRNPRSGTTDGPIHVRIAGDSVATHLRVAAAAETEVLTGDGPCASILDRVPLTMISRRGRDTSFAAVLEPTAVDGSPSVSSVTQSTSDETTRIVVRRAGGTDVITVTGAGSVTVSTDGENVLTASP
jgi:hypothetical protein